MIDAYLELLDEAYYEATVAFEGLADHNVWKRPAEGLLSIGEIAGHVAHWEAVKLTGEGGTPEPDLSKCRVNSLLIDRRFRYYPTTIATPPSDDHRAMSADQVCSELLRVHTESIAYFKALNPDLDSRPIGWPPRYTYRAFVTYAGIHVAYHTGQIYSVRHLLGDEMRDN